MTSPKALPTEPQPIELNNLQQKLHELLGEHKVTNDQGNTRWKDLGALKRLLSKVGQKGD